MDLKNLAKKAIGKAVQAATGIPPWVLKVLIAAIVVIIIAVVAIILKYVNCLESPFECLDPFKDAEAKTPIEWVELFGEDGTSGFVGEMIRQRRELNASSTVSGDNYETYYVEQTNNSEDEAESEDETEPGTINGDLIVSIATELNNQHGKGSGDEWGYSQVKRDFERFGTGDCSTFVNLVLTKAGIGSIGGYTQPQIANDSGEFIKNKSDLKPGDVVFFKRGSDMSKPASHFYRDPTGDAYYLQHVGIYVGQESGTHYMIDIGNDYDRLGKRSMDSSYWDSRFAGARRFTAPGTGDGGVSGDYKTVTEAEIHIRSILQVESELIGRTKLDEKELKDSDSNIGKVWREVVLPMKEDFDKNTNPFGPNFLYKSDDEYRNTIKTWSSDNWIERAQYHVLRCYYLGEDCDMYGVSNIVEESDQSVLTQRDVLITKYYECIMPPPPPPEPEEPTTGGDTGGTTGPGGPQEPGGSTDSTPTPTGPGGPQEISNKELNVPKLTRLDNKKEEIKVKRVAKENVTVKKVGHDQPCDGGEIKLTNEVKTSEVKYKNLVYDVAMPFSKYSVADAELNLPEGETFDSQLTFWLTRYYKQYANKDFSDIVRNTEGFVGGSYIVPMEKGTYNFTSEFTSNRCFNGSCAPHRGIDLGTGGHNFVPVYATAHGVVIGANYSSSYGYNIMIDHRNGYFSTYSHLSEGAMLVTEGQEVLQGQMIGGVGDTGDSSGPHLHFEICTAANSVKNCERGTQVNPEEFVTPEGTRNATTISESISYFNEAKAGMASDPNKKFMMPGYSGSSDIGNAMQWLHWDIRNQYDGITAEQIDAWIASKRSDSMFIGKGHVFLQAAKEAKLDVRYILSHAMLESTWGTSSIARNKYNFFGISVFDTNTGAGYVYKDIDDGILTGSKWIAEHYPYSKYQQYTIYKMRWNDGVHQYATDGHGPTNPVTGAYDDPLSWDEKIAIIWEGIPK